MRKIAIPTENGVLSTHFGHCKHFTLIEVKNDSIGNETVVEAPPHEPGLLPKWLAERGVTEIISGGIGQKAVNLFKSNNIIIHAGAPNKPANELVRDLIDNRLMTGTNACDH
ncbi:NifB/NifX family molybdenum-iron cluster-binding protein [Sunxiuqinia indica]|uniref:NifB/NifX family molybdenum-iron cluster-binding protein n=1 Tax=Sunxiuqinia indica TaxID=2692584 RepID=UPI0013570C0A|nr:NifB/NifX family molybdenum-iron cluster-binding protein [Sunxiuqinia indica]